ncbi:hypothetical protein LRAMOSA02779 [Lichtheimia ramosa]|uniref:Endopeptidase S2P n=1 Tax=Lichtheimia ramosa TaxID=688394 RepID=A0A077WTV7_9FUNG|nr:hypothetical protein LRAMOSA02779 [Lichtheimia ramosa]
MAVGLVVIAYAAWRIIAVLWYALRPTTTTDTTNAISLPNRLAKRAFEQDNVDTAMVDNDDNGGQVFQPMIPGITVPLSHLGYYLLALLVCGIFHEAGHAIASFSQRVRIKSAGVFMYYIYPGAFVNIPDQALSLLSPFNQLKIICAGVWHNIVLYLWVLFFLSGGLKLCLLLVGWQSLEGLGGVSVVSVRKDSPLVYHLPTSSIVYQLNDFVLDDNIASWNTYLLDNQQRHDAQQGFCASNTTRSNDTTCCDIDDNYPFGQSSNTSISCFRDFHPDTSEPKWTLCLPTTQVLVSQDAKRCSSDADCQVTDQCVTPYTPSTRGQFVRVYIKSSPSDVENTGAFVFEGELVDIWESVKVGILHPRFWFLPVWIPHTVELFLRYISSFTLALALLNILPAFQLDGEFALGQLLALVSRHGPASPLSTGNTTPSQHYTRRIVKVTSAVVGFVIIGSILLGVAQQ